MKKKLMAVFILTITLLMTAGCGAFMSSIDEISSEVPDGWIMYEGDHHTEISDENRKSGLAHVAGYDCDYMWCNLYYMKYGPACSGEVSDFHNLKDTEEFLESRGYDALWAYIEAEEGYSRQDDADDIKMKPVKVIEGYEIPFVKLKVDCPDLEEDDEYYLYIGHLRDNIYYIFDENTYTYEEDDDLSMAEQKEDIEKCDGEFEEIVAGFMDEGYLDTFLEMLDNGGNSNEAYRQLPIKNITLVLMILVLAATLCYGILRNKKSGRMSFMKGDKKTEKKTVDGKTTVTVHCTYEDSLKSLLDSGLITKKEYKELLEKHYR